MKKVTVVLKEAGETIRFEWRGSGSALEVQVQYIPGWLIVTDAYGDQMAWPSEDVRSVDAEPAR